MCKLKFLILTLCVMMFVNCSTKKSALSEAERKIEQRIDSVMDDLTLEEKVGQMAQYTVDVIGRQASPNTSIEPFEFNEEKMDTLLSIMKVGSILNTTNNKAQSVQTWQFIVKTIQEKALKATGIPVLYGVDAIHGTTYTVGATLFPQQIGMAATFNTALMEEGSRISAYETRASNIPYSFAPVLDLGRDARWPRMWETFGEDVFLAKQMGLASVRGFQGTNKSEIGKYNVAVSLKHFMGYGVPVYGKDRTPAIITESDLREKHFEAFRAAVKAGALSIMVNSGIVNNVSTHADDRLLTNWLKTDLNYDGVLITDWNDVENLYLRDNITGDFKTAVQKSINAGIDLVMVPYRMDFCKVLIELVNEGKVSETRIDDAVRRVLRMKFRLGLFEKPYWNAADYADFGSSAHKAAAKAAADESITLLKNEDNVLPLKQGVRILVCGPNANSMRTLNGGWSYSWQGEKTELFTQQYNTIYESIRNKFGEKNVHYVAGIEYDMNGMYSDEKEPAIANALAAAVDVDYIVLCVGENTYCETPGNLDELALSDNQLLLAKALQKTGKPVILVLNEGRPRIIRTIEPGCKAIVHTYLPGNYGADALADILIGEVNPSGKLPFTYPKYEQGLITYDHKPSQNLEKKMEGAYDYGAQTSVQYPFGFGLSYTNFEYSSMKVNKPTFVSGDTLTITVDVKNSGTVNGKEAVMLFSRDMVASISPDVRRLRAFSKTILNPGEKKTITLQLAANDLSFANENGKWILEAGEFALQVGNQVVMVKCIETKRWDSPNKD